MIKSPPCKDCAERFQACWDRCPKDARGEYGYKAWRDQINAEKRAKASQYGVGWTDAKRKATWKSLLRDYSGAVKKVKG